KAEATGSIDTTTPKDRADIDLKAMYSKDSGIIVENKAIRNSPNKIDRVMFSSPFCSQANGKIMTAAIAIPRARPDSP
ncbi:hypothetical protein JTL78_36490, partial [Pseudomonas aeruginosa]|nr:hypothetical protein [Pseudomonas aeruginosa]